MAETDQFISAIQLSVSDAQFESFSRYLTLLFSRCFSWNR